MVASPGADGDALFQFLPQLIGSPEGAQRF